MKYKFHLTLSFIFLVYTLFAQNKIQSPDEFLPHRLGEQFTDHSLLVDYYRQVAAKSDRVKLIEFGRTYQQRPQILAIVSSPENMRRIEEIRLNHLRSTGLVSGSYDSSSAVAIVWLGYSVHGNEAAGSEASMRVLYELTDPANAQVQEWLKNTVVLIEPSVNPDGYSRYTDWYRNVSPKLPDPNPDAREHDEPWPGGRVNHYLFDLNRDWAWATQIETQNRLKIYNDWMPHVAADLHEQYYDAPYYFAPAAQPYHTFLTKWQADFQVEIGKNHAKYFDENGWLYYTREIFDLFYPSYGDTYPSFNGAIGMTYEQGGHARAGRAIIMPNGDTLTLSDRIAHHTTTSLSTIEISSKKASQLIQHFQDYFKKSQTNPPGEYKTFIVKATNHPHKIKALTTLLDRHHIIYGRAGKVNESVGGYDYVFGYGANYSIGENDLIISAYQPKGLLAQVLFEPTSELVDSLTYDITAWSLPRAFGLQAIATKHRFEPREAYTTTLKITRSTSGSPYAYLAEWNSLQSARFLAEVLKKDIVVRYSESGFGIGGTSYLPGTLVITRADNRKNPDFDKIVRETSTSLNYPVTAVETGFVTTGRDFGSESMRLIDKPNVLVLSGDKTFANEFGQVWFYFDRELNYPATILDAGQLSKINLGDYNVLVLPEGSYGFDDAMIDKLGDWVNAGGRLIAIGEANRSLVDKKGFSLAKYASDADKDAAQKEADEAALKRRTDYYQDRIRSSISDNMPGAVVGVKMDKSHPLAFGLNDPYFSLKTSNQRYDLIKNAWNVGRLESNYPVYGFIGANLKNELKNSAVFAVQNKGNGAVIYLVDNPLFRAFWEEGKLLFSNAVFLVK